jgi:hypothetical protein
LDFRRFPALWTGIESFIGDQKETKKDTAAAKVSTTAQVKQRIQVMFAGKNFDFELEMPGKILTAPGADSIRGSKACCHSPISALRDNDLTVEASSE